MRYVYLLLAAVCQLGFGCSVQEHSSAAAPAPVVVSRPHSPTSCPQCGSGALVKVETIHDDTANPSKNIAVWNRSSCVNPFYDADSLICKNCWLAFSKTFDRWELCSVLPESFRRPLVAAIREFPLPPAADTKSLVVYSQEIGADNGKESVAFWCLDSAACLTQIKAFAREHKLYLRVEQHGRIEKQAYVVIETKTPR